ncbi:hypothetical protein KAI92_00995 [Candidatus Parcubacteria bacterium]|nr:hypothetical protein [Candidatus Parcubacteria bacterium]
MIKIKNGDNQEEDDDNNNNGVIKINAKESSLLEFTKRPLPNEKQIKVFEDYVKTESKDEQIEESLNEIYQDDRGEMVNVGKMDVLKRRGFLFWFFGFIFLILIGMGVFAYIYNNIYLKSSDGKSDIEFSVDGKNEVFAGEEFVYTIHYKNLSNIAIKDVLVEVKFPDNFIFLDSEPEVSQNNNIWELSEIKSQHTGKIKIKGKIIDFRGDTNVLLTYMTYTPENFSSEFKKDASIATIVKDLGMDIEFDFIKTVLIGEESSIDIKLKIPDISFMNNFRISFDPQENIKILEAKNDDNDLSFDVIRPGVWQINKVLTENKTLPIKLKFTEKISDNQNLVFNFYKESEDGKLYKFFEKELDFEVMKSDLNLALIINGSRNEQGIEFGQKLNYSIVYSNKGEAPIKDIILIAVMESEFLEWDTLADENEGIEKGNTISWTKEQIPELENLESGMEGVIDYSIFISELDEIVDGAEYKVNNYIQYSVGEEASVVSENSQSNTILVKINSNLELNEQVRYFSDDNIPVGIGPHPPKVDEETSYKVYWNLTNSLHELNNLIIKTKLPNYVFWGERDSVSVGVIQFNEETREIEWNIGRLPATIHSAEAEFDIKVKPQEEDKNKIMILLTGSTVEAKDSETDDELKETTKAKTTKLEDDEIAEGDGIIN